MHTITITNIERENMTLHNNTVLHESARISGTYIQVFNISFIIVLKNLKTLLIHSFSESCSLFSKR